MATTIPGYDTYKLAAPDDGVGNSESAEAAMKKETADLIDHLREYRSGWVSELARAAGEPDATDFDDDTVDAVDSLLRFLRGE